MVSFGALGRCFCGGFNGLFFGASMLESSLQTAFQEWKEQILSSIKLEEPEAEENEDPCRASGQSLRASLWASVLQSHNSHVLALRAHVCRRPKRLVSLKTFSLAQSHRARSQENLQSHTCS